MPEYFTLQSSLIPYVSLVLALVLSDESIRKPIYTSNKSFENLSTLSSYLF